jgi:2'-5' RNA ligase
MGRIRAFVAVELPQSARLQLAQVQQRLRLSLPDLAYVRPEGIHITLKFLGELSQEQIGAIASSIRTVVNGFPRFRLHVDGLGTFPEYGQPRVLWLGLQGDLKTLRLLAAKLELAMKQLGIPQEDRPFAPHLTLARVRRRLDAQELAALRQLTNQLAGGIGHEFEVTEVSLMRSHLQRGGALYERLETFPLDQTHD